MATALTLQSQMTALQQDLKTTLETFFANLPEMESLNSMSAALVEQSQFHVIDNETFVAATELVSAHKSVEEEIEALINPFIDRLFKAHRASTAIRKSYLDPGQNEQKRFKLEREQFAAEQERMRREAAQKAQQEAQERAQAVLFEEARQAAATGNTAAAEAILEEAVNVEAPPVVLPSTVPQVQGLSFRSVWEWTLGDRRKLKDEFLKVDDVAIGKIVRSMHQAATTLCGEPGAINVIERKVPVDR